MNHQLCEVDVLKTATCDPDRREEPCVAETERHAEPEATLAGSGSIFSCYSSIRPILQRKRSLSR